MKHTKGSLIVTVASTMYLYMFMVRVLPSSIPDILMVGLDISANMVGQIMTSFVLAYALCQIPGGIMVDRYGPRKVMLAAMIGCSLGSYLFQSIEAWTPILGAYRIYVGLFARIILGISCSCAFIAPLQLIKQWLPAQYFSTATGLVQLLGCVGAMLSAPIAEIVRIIGWKDTINLTFLIAIGLFILYFLSIHEKERTEKQTVSAMQTLKTITTQPQYWHIGLIAISSWAIIGGFSEAWGISFLSQLQGISMSEAAYQINWTYLSVAIISPLGGFWASQAQSPKTPILTLQIAGTIAFILLISAQITDPTIIKVLLFIMGTSAGTQPIAFGLVDLVAPSALLATAVSFCNVCVIAGAFALQPLITGLLSAQATNSIQSFQIAFLPIILIMLFGMIAGINVHKLKPHNE